MLCLNHAPRTNNPLITSQLWPRLGSIFLWLSPHRHCMLQVSHSHWCSHSLCNPRNLATSYGSSVSKRAASCLYNDYGPALALANQQSSPVPSGLQLYLSHQGWNTNQGGYFHLLLSLSFLSPQPQGRTEFYLIVTLLSQFKSSLYETSPIQSVLALRLPIRLILMQSVYHPTDHLLVTKGDI